MYDIKIFLEDDGKIWARANLWKEKIYAVWDDYISLLNSLREWLELTFDECCFSQRISTKNSKIYA